MTHKEMWSKFINKNNLDLNEYTAWQFGDTPDELADLVLKGIKKSTTSLLDVYDSDLRFDFEKENYPKIGEYSVILNSKNEAVCIIKTVEVNNIPYCQITEKQAIDEGDGSLENWYNIHRRFYGDILQKLGKEFNENIILVYEEFEVVYK